MNLTIGLDEGSRGADMLDLPSGLEASHVLRALLSASNDCVKLLDLDGRLLFMSEGGKRVMEVDDFTAIQHCPWPDFWRGEEQRAAKDAVTAGRDGKASRFLGYTGTAKGTMKYWDVQVLPVADDSGQPAYLLSISKDVSELRSADIEIHRLMEEAQQNERRFRTLADVMPQMVWSTLPDGYHDYYNARWYEFTGMQDGSTDGEGWNALFHPDDQERAWAVWRHSLATGETYEIEYRLRHHSGDYRWVLGRALPLRGADGTIDRWYGTCTDIHAAKETSENLALLSQELSHRIKNIFAIINGLIGQSARWYPDSKAFASDVQQRLAALGRAHDFVRPHSEASRTLSSLPTVQNLLREILRPYRALEENRIVIVGDDVLIDDRAATPLALVFHELATNAAKYGALSTPAGTVNIALSAEGEMRRIAWLENGGPAIVEEPRHRGFGTKLSAVSVEGQLGGSLSRHWLPEGLSVQIECPAASFSRG